jgi:hypothetical protein
MTTYEKWAHDMNDSDLLYMWRWSEGQGFTMENAAILCALRKEVTRRKLAVVM